MSNVRGRIAVDILFTDSTTSSDEQSLKTLTLQDATEYTTGKVAIVTGTCSTATDILVSVYTPGYTNSSGQSVSFTSISRVAFQASRPARLFVGLTSFGNSSGNVSINDYEQPFGGTHFNPRTTAGTASYTLVIYGS